MDDLIAEIDRLHAEATPGPWRLSAGGCYIDGKDGEVAVCSSVRDGRLIHALLSNWPAIRDRLREAERRAKALDEELQSVLADWNAARAASGSRTNGGLVGHIGDLARRAKAFDAIASVNAKHRKTTPTIETVAEYLNSGEPGRSESPCYGLIDAVRALHAEVDCRIEHGATSGGHLEYVRCKLADMLRKADIREVDLTSPVGNPPETPDRSAEVPGANPAVTLAFKRSLDEASAIVAEWPAWKRDALKSVRETLESVPDEPVTNPAKVAESDGTKALRLVARLADLCRHRWSDLSPISCDAKAAEDLASEARGGGE